jgi:hypothetical protein
MEVKTVQTFSRRGLGFLWSKRSELDPGQEAIINSIYNNKKSKSIEGKQSITYKLSNEKAGKLGFGRLYGNKGSLETLEKECRGTLCNEYYTDVDIVNCHPVLLVQYAKSKYDKDLVEVEKYVDNREDYLKATGLPRAEAKQSIIQILYGGKTENDKLKPMKREVQAFSKFLSTQAEYTELFEYAKTKDNIYGSFLSYILQTEERKCMLAMKAMIEKQDFSVDVLAYDGVMVRKRIGNDNKEEFYDGCYLTEVEEYVKKETGYNITLDIKPFSFYDVPEMAEELVPNITTQQYNDMKIEFEKDHFYYYPTNQYAEVRDGLVNMYDYAHAKVYFGLKYYYKISDKFGDNIDFFPLWNEDKTRKSIERIDFKPTDDPNVYVLPINFIYEKTNPPTETQEVLKVFEELLSLNTGHNLILKDYVRNYLAHLLQQPLDLPGVALIFTGKKGTGKDTMIDFLMEFVLGYKYAHNYENNNDFFEKHDLGRKDKFLVKIEEADRALCMSNASALKSRITSKTETFNPKGLTKITTSNYCRFIFTTNKPNPVEMNDGERRFVIIPTSSDKKGDHNYWINVRKVLFNPEAGRIVADYLLSHNINGFNPRVLPYNEYQNAVVKSEMSADEQFFENGEWDGEATQATELFNRYKSYCISKDLEYVGSMQKFGRILTKYMKLGETIQLYKKEERDGVYYSTKKF